MEQFDLELAHQTGENQHRLRQSELRADAGPRAGAERQIGKPPRRFGVRQKPFRNKQIGVTPQLFVAMQHPGDDQHDGAGRDRDAGGTVAGARLADDRKRRRVQPQRLIDNGASV